MLSSNTKSINNTQTMVMLSLFIALSVVFGKQLSFTLGAIRISFENLPILMAGIFFGCGAGALVGGLADIVGCLIMGYTINPIITLGSMAVGFISGFVYKSLRSTVTDQKLKFAISIMTAHIIGSMIVKSIGLYVYYHYDISILLLRVPLYLVIGSLETTIIYLLSKHSSVKPLLNRLNQ